MNTARYKVYFNANGALCLGYRDPCNRLTELLCMPCHLRRKRRGWPFAEWTARAGADAGALDVKENRHAKYMGWGA
jgi:hypothetical protein